jgi:hypothetical protein
MSDEAFQVYEKAYGEQQYRSQARHIRTKVTEARHAQHSAGIRWPFELLQNALDAGPRPNATSVTVNLRCTHELAAFEHDGAPFTSSELAALLSGGSSKEFESVVTTGRFGTGFLVTHVLAPHMTLRGILALPTGQERFQLRLDRSGDEDSILANIRSCNESIRSAEPITVLDGEPSARFEYPVSEDSSIQLGAKALHVALPYLFGTCHRLGEVTLSWLEGATEVWTPGASSSKTIEGGLVEEREIHVVCGTSVTEYRILRFGMSDSSHAMVLLRQCESGWMIEVPDAETPRVFRQYPLRGATFVPIHFVIDARVEPDQERSRALMTAEDREVLASGFKAAVLAMRHLREMGLVDVDLLARVDAPSTCFEPNNAEEAAWWRGQLKSFANDLAHQMLVHTTEGWLPAAEEVSPCADFIVPRLSSASKADETSVERLWPLFFGSNDLCPPLESLTGAWSRIGAGWSALDVGLNRVDLKRLGTYVREGVEDLGELRVKEKPEEWLARYIDAVGECWSARGGIDGSVLESLLPDQRDRLRSPEQLARDVGIPEELKDLCAEVGIDVRTELLSTGLIAKAEELGLPSFREAVGSAVPRTLDETQLLQRIVEHVRNELPEGSDVAAEKQSVARGSVRLLTYLWTHHGNGGAAVAQQLPFVCSTGRVVRWGAERLLMAPVKRWHVDAQPFAGAYPPMRVLHGIYAIDDETDIVSALVAWGISIADPLTRDTPAELRDRRLAAMAAAGQSTDGAVVRGESFTQIALLQPEVLNRCQEGFEEARALLGLLLRYIAPQDDGWREQRAVKARRGGEDLSLEVRGALWLGDLRSRAWVPFPGEDGKAVKVNADPRSLRDLLDGVWLHENNAAISLLSDFFGFDELELRLIGIEPEVQQQVRAGLARILESGGADPELYESVAQEIEAKRRRSVDVERCRRIGLAVQEAVGEALKRRKREGRIHDVTLVDRGFDFEVKVPTERAIEDGASLFEVGTYLVEVKATTTGPVRLTPKQATTASERADEFVLCVVDLRGVDAEKLDSEWTAGDVEPLTRLVAAIGKEVEQTWDLVEMAKESDVAIRNDSALRYEVPVSAWRVGISIDEWLDRIGKT